MGQGLGISSKGHTAETGAAVMLGVRTAALPALLVAMKISTQPTAGALLTYSVMTAARMCTSTSTE